MGILNVLCALLLEYAHECVVRGLGLGTKNSVPSKNARVSWYLPLRQDFFFF